MDKQVLVIGLGQFGMAIVNSLSALEGVELIAVDRRPEVVELAARLVSEAICMDATDEMALARLSPHLRDVCVCAIGDEAREASFICTALLRQMGAKRILARSTDSLHERILRLVGAHEVFNPERDFGNRLAAHVAYEGVLGEYHLADGVSISELKLPSAFVGKTMLELSLPKKFGVTIVAIQRNQETIVVPDPNQPLCRDDVLVVVARAGVISKLMDRFE